MEVSARPGTGSQPPGTPDAASLEIPAGDTTPPIPDAGVQSAVGETPPESSSQPAIPENASPPADPEPTEHMHTVPDSAFQKIKSRAREKGREQAMSDFNEMAKVAGFDSPEAMFAGMAAMQKQIAAMEGAAAQVPAEKPAPTTVTAATPPARPRRNLTGLKAEHAKETTRLRTRLDGEVARRKRAETQINAQAAEMEFRTAAARAGVQDVDYAMMVFSRGLDGKTDAELAEVDEAAFFTDLREKKPYLFGEVLLAVTTGTDANGAPAPGPGKVAEASAGSGVPNHRDSSRADYSARLAALGLQNPGAGTPLGGM